jgi:hypothetical protein
LFILFEQYISEGFLVILLQSLKILSTMAAMRLDKLTDQIEHLLFSSLMDESGDIPSSQRTGATPDPLASNTWEEVMVSMDVYPYHYMCVNVSTQNTRAHSCVYQSGL